DRRDRHAFPTRRSSDLRTAPSTIEERLGWTARTRRLDALSFAIDGVLRADEAVRWVAGATCGAPGWRGSDRCDHGDGAARRRGVDRKSTRLNSSHVKIS